MSSEENIGFGIDENIYERMKSTVPEELWPQNLHGFFIQGSKAFFSAISVDQAFVDRLVPHLSSCDEDTCTLHPELLEMTPAVRGSTYIQGVDPALTFDSTWSVVLARNKDGTVGVGVRASHYNGRATGPVICGIALDGYNAYAQGANYCQTGIDATGFGGKMFYDALGGAIPYLHCVEFGGTVGKKLKLLNDLKQLLENGRLRFPRKGIWLKLRRQLLGYRIPDKGLSTDGVMALAVAASMMVRSPAGSVSALPFDFFGVNPVVGSRPTSGPRSASYTSVSDMERRERGAY
jgi:hypothetical protein